MSEIDRSRYLTVTRESVAAAADEAKRWVGGPLRMEKGSRNYFRFMPAFKMNAQGIPQWWSYGMRHYTVPLLGGEEGKSVTMDCPQTIGARCLVCENKKLFQQLGRWDDFKGCSPRKRVYFNIIDIQNIEAGVQILEDGPKLWGLLREEFEEENEQLFDPFTGSVLIVISKDADPWRKLKYPKAHQCSLDEIHADALTWALPENLEDLDNQWDFPTLEQQQETFALMGFGSQQLAAPAPQALIGAQPAAPAQPPAAPAPAPVTAGVAAILEEEVIEAEVVSETPAPAPAPAPASAPAAAAPAAVPPAPAASPPAPATAAILAEVAADQASAPAVVAEAAAPPAGVSAILAEANAASSPVPGDAAPAPTPAAPAPPGGGSNVLAGYIAGMEDEEQDGGLVD